MKTVGKNIKKMLKRRFLFKDNNVLRKTFFTSMGQIWDEISICLSVCLSVCLCVCVSALSRSQFLSDFDET